MTRTVIPAHRHLLNRPPTPLRPDVEAELTLAEITGLQWANGQTRVCGCILAYTEVTVTFSWPIDVFLTLYLPDGRRIGGPSILGCTERELQYKALVWGIGVALDAQAAARRCA